MAAPENQPVASIIIPAFNASEFIQATLDSINAQQTSSPLEVIIVNDGSTDSTREIVENYSSDLPIKCITIENSGGPSKPRNVGIDAANGEYIFVFDSDDLMLPGKVTDCLTALEQFPEAGFLFTNFETIDAKGNLLKEDFLEKYETLYNLPYRTVSDGCRLIESEDLLRGLATANFIGTSSIVIRKSALNEIGKFDENIKNGDDFDLWVRLANKYHALFLDKVFHQYRIHHNSISNSNHSRRLENLITLNNKHLSGEFSDFFKAKSKEKIARLSYVLAKQYLKSGNNAGASKYARLAIKFNHKRPQSILIVLISLLPSKIAIVGSRWIKKVI